MHQTLSQLELSATPGRRAALTGYTRGTSGSIIGDQLPQRICQKGDEGASSSYADRAEMDLKLQCHMQR